jgi:hypothetical protein
MCTPGSPTTFIVVCLSIKSGSIAGFTKRYNISRVVYYETFRYVGNAIAREKQIKAWTRAKRLALIKGINPWWQDLAEGWGAKTELQIPRCARDDNQFEHIGGAREVAALRFSDMPELRNPRIEDYDGYNHSPRNRS